MSWKSFACVAALGAMISPAVAQPTFNLTDTGSELELSIVPDGTLLVPSALAVELDLVFSGVTLGTVDSSVINSTAWDEPTPGANPFTLTNTEGLYVDGNNIFLSYGSVDSIAAETLLASIPYTGTGSVDVASSANIIAQGLTGGGADTYEVAAQIAFSLGMMLIDGDVDGDGTVGPVDLATVGNNWDPLGANGPYTRADGDLDGDGTIGPVDLAQVGNNWNPLGASAAVPEPTAMILGGVALAGVLVRRR